jgi:hypothetical protein
MQRGSGPFWPFDRFNDFAKGRASFTRLPAARCLDMRRPCLTTLILLIVSILAAGCRQTPGPNGAASASSMNPLTPMTSGQSPSLGVFGGSTRVTPPSTAGFAAPNSYLGGPGIAPVDPNAAGIGPLGAYAPPQTGNAIGSGVQVAGWNDANRTMAPAPTLGVAPSPGIAPTYGSGSPSNRDPRGGGMKVIDMTRTATPPGYRAPAPRFRSPPPTVGPPPTVAPQPTWPQSGPIQGSLRPVNMPPGGQIATGGLTPIPPTSQQIPINPAPIDPNQPRTATAPSTEPVTSGGSQQDLLWRQPDTRF